MAPEGDRTRVKRKYHLQTLEAWPLKQMCAAVSPGDCYTWLLSGNCVVKDKRLSTANKYGKLSGIPLLHNIKETDVHHLLYGNIKIFRLLSNCQK